MGAVFAGRSVVLVIRGIPGVGVAVAMILNLPGAERAVEIVPLTSTETENDKDGKKGETFHVRPS
jgi:hypothetical protein